MKLSVPPDHRVKLKERGKRDTYLDFGKEIGKTMKHVKNSQDNNKMTVKLTVIDVLGIHQKMGTASERLGSKMENRDYPI